ncbi:hypothetical protein MAMC_01276 [Methylacidimicrobium cyclopophantes]|uniref:CRISPR-associated protein Csx3 n=1 Tax=Methylacidimicrobium cyclopophantes TaxID=1041766 RepID=A0A5E6ML84_9BACT|nr:CRISPR-associated ring nuclease Crn3/Csx3 [Methylacidimicrobium cyclopophantes]VVM06817.1 hypothetical protein MAMC_01276 [Methylacidimicrobium cyclopophantes]
MKNLNLRLISPPTSFQILVIQVAGNGILDARELAGVALPEGIDYEKGLILYGKGPIWLYVYLAHLAHACRWLGVYDPRFGGIVVEAHHPESPSVGEMLASAAINPYLTRRQDAPPATILPGEARNRIVAVVGPPHSGKSVFLFWIQQALRSRSPESFHRNLFVLRACPDGEGDWFFEAQEEGKTLRYKNRWDAEFVDRIVEQIKSLSRSKTLLLVDCGGKIDRLNQAILNVCTDVLIVSRDAEAFAEWRGAARSSGLQTLAEVESVREPESKVLSESPLRLRIGGLERSARPSPLPEQLLAQLIPFVETEEQRKEAPSEP